MKRIIERDALHHESSFRKEYVLSNGIGGYISSSILSSLERKHHGYLIASMNPPIERKMILAKIDEEVFVDDKIQSFTSQNYLNGRIHSSYLKKFEYEYHPVFFYSSDYYEVKKEIAPLYGKNTVAITYEIETKQSAIEFVMIPLFAYRDHSNVSTLEDLDFKSSFEGQILKLQKKTNEVLYFSVSEGEYFENENKISSPFVYQIDYETGDSRTDLFSKPYSIKKKIPAFSHCNIEIICSTNEIPQMSAFQIIKEYDLIMNKVISHPASLNLPEKYQKPFSQLLSSAFQFVVKRESTSSLTVLAGYPWFTDWGRDTMIAFEGILLVTNRFEEAKSVLLSFQQYEHHGLIPNMFPDLGSQPLYNTVDASLWYINAAYLYYIYTLDEGFIRNSLYQTMHNIVENYKIGTDFNIGMDEDGLIHAGSGLDQVTWMDVRINGEVITPRHGKPVEINALWYNALMIMNFFDAQFGLSLKYEELASLVKTSFKTKFWNKEASCLYDVIDEIDPSIRPNQLYAVSLPFKMLNHRQSKLVLKKIEEELLDFHGLRSLSKNDLRFIPKYEGDIIHRDHAYHMGTSWGFLLGTYLQSYLDTYQYSKRSIKKVLIVLDNALTELDQGCLNGYAEVFDGLNGKSPKGCFSQAWSVAELLRVLNSLAKEWK